MTSCRAITSGPEFGGLLRVPEEVGEAEVPVPRLAREGEPGELARRVVRVADDQRLALGVARPVAVDHRGFHQAVGVDPVEPAGAGAGVPRSRRVPRSSVRPVTDRRPHWPMNVARSSSQAGHLGQLQSLDHAACPRTAAWARRRAGRRRSVAAPERKGDCPPSVPRLRGHPAATRLGQGRAGHARLDRHHLLHQRQALERVLGVADLAGVEVVEVLLDEGPGERGAAEDHRERGQAALVELLQVVAHHDGGLHQQARHADRVGVVRKRGLDDRAHRLLDARG